MVLIFWIIIITHVNISWWDVAVPTDTQCFSLA